MSNPDQAAAQIADRITRRAILGARYDATLARKSLSLLDALERDLVAQIAAADVAGVSSLSARRVRLDKLLKLAREAIRDNYRRIKLNNDHSYAELLSIEAGATRDILGRAFVDAGFDIGVSLPTDATYAALLEDKLVMGRPLEAWWDAQEEGTAQAFAGQMRIGVQAGETVDQLARRIAGGSLDGVPVRGVMNTSRTWAKGLARTSVASVQNSAREAVYRANSDVISEYVHISRLDSRTTPICISRAGLTWDAQTLKPIGHNQPYENPPLHISCRSVMGVHVIGGQTKVDQSGERWLKGLSEAEQDDVLGVGKAQLFRDGKIGVGDLVDQSNRALTLAELRRLSSN